MKYIKRAIEDVVDHSAKKFKCVLVLEQESLKIEGEANDDLQ